MAEKTSGSSGSGASATQEKPADKRYGGDEPLDYPKHEPLDTVTYRDPRPLDWPQKADRSVFIGAVHSTDTEDDGSEKKGYVYPGKVHDDEELEVGGTAVKDAQVISGSGQVTLIVNGETLVLGGLAGGILADLQQALNYSANS
jgi:hypothetical protein